MKTVRPRRAVAVCVIVLILYIFYRRRKTTLSDGPLMQEDSWLGGRMKGTGQKFEQWIVVTTIQQPTLNLQKLASLSDWKMVVVGDRKTPSDWTIPGVVFLDVEKQQALEYSIYSHLPFDSYTRKIMGYLYAIEHGAKIIYETDDDNFIEDLSSFTTTMPHSTVVVTTDSLTFNPYQHFGQSTVWPRGLPLSMVGQKAVRKYDVCEPHIAAVQQGIVDGEPDVDAIFRMTRKQVDVDLDIKFDMQAPPVSLPLHTFAPMNTQNTLHTYTAFWALLLPTTVKDRATDIYRSYWAQKLLSLTCNHVSFHPTPTNQQRNKWHTNVNDARDEVELYTQLDNLVEFLKTWTCTKTFLFECMYQLTKDMVYMGYLEKRDMNLVQAFTTDLSTLGYSPPQLVSKKSCHRFTKCSELIYYPWEQTTSWPHTSNKSIAPFLGFGEKWKSTIAVVCGAGSEVLLQEQFAQTPLFPDVLLVVTLYSSVHLIPVFELMYRPHFPHILYCGATEVKKVNEKNWQVTYVSLGVESNPEDCLLKAVKLNYHVAGYLHITAHHFLSVKNLHVSNHNKHQVWISGEDLYVLDNEIENYCNANRIHCTTLQAQQFESFKDALVGVHLPFANDQKENKIRNCLMKIGADPTLKNTAVINREIVMFLPQDKATLYVDLIEQYLKNSVFDGYRFLAFVLMQCLDTAPEFLHSRKPEGNDKTHFDYLFPLVKSEMETYRALACNTIHK